jgi:hypothetical protein
MILATGDKKSDSGACDENKTNATDPGWSGKLGNFCRVGKVNFLSKTGR